MDCDSEGSLRSLLDREEYAFRFDIGIGLSSGSVNLANIDRTLQLFAKHYIIFSVKSEIDQLTEGLSVLKVLDLIHENPNKMKELFIYSDPVPLTTESMLRILPAIYSSLLGSNKRELEEATIMLWIHFLQIIECKTA